VDRFGAPRVAGGGLCGLAVGAALLARLPLSSGLAGYLLPIVSMTVSYALFQTANNTAVMQCAAPQQRGVLAGLLNVSRNLGLTSGAALMGALFAWGVGNSDMAHAAPEAVAAGMRLTFAVAVAMVGLAGWRSMGRWPDAGSQTPANTR
jgi:MFS family permease